MNLPLPGRAGADRLGQLHQDIGLGVVGDGVNGVQAQAVEAVFLQLVDFVRYRSLAHNRGSGEPHRHRGPVDSPTQMRWMNSGPISRLREICFPELQPGSSIMPRKANPVAPEAVSMACVQAIGLDTAVALAAQDNRFRLATMLLRENQGQTWTLTPLLPEAVARDRFP
jgi:hypothetical protein